MSKFGANMQRMGQNMAKYTTLPILGVGAAAVKVATDFESAFAGVIKTVDATESELSGLRRGILQMSKELPTSANEIAGVAEAAGQLGIQTDAILGFTKTMVMLGDSTNITAKDAATALARIANIIGLPQDQFDRLGSTIVELGNNFATTESEIVNMATRLAAAGNISKMAESDIFAIATALSSVGVEAESGGTAAQKGILLINDAVARGSEELNVFAKTAGMSAEQFQTAWRKDSTLAFAEFVKGLGTQGDMATKTLEDVGLSNERARTAFLSLANAGDLLNRTIETGRRGFEENTALVDEANKRYETFASKVQMAKNRLIAMGVTVGDVIIPHLAKAIEWLEKLTDKFSSMSEESIKRVVKVSLAVALLPPAIYAVGTAFKGLALAIAVVKSPITAVIGLFLGVVGTMQWFVDNWTKIALAVENKARAVLIGFQYMAKGVLVSLKSIIEFIANNVSAAGLISKMFGIDLGGLATEKLGLNKAIEGMDKTIEEGEEKLKQSLLEYNNLPFTTWIESFKKAGELAKNTIKRVTGSIAEEIEKGLASSTGSGESTDSGIEVPIRVKMDTSGINLRGLMEANLQVKSFGKVAEKSFNMASIKWKTFVHNFKQMGGEFKSFLAGEISSAVLSFGSALGASLSGAENSWQTTFEKIIMVVLDFASSLAKLASAIGAVMLFIPGLQGAGAGLLGAALALQAISTGVSMGIEKRASNRDARATSVNDALITSGGKVIKFHPDDNILAMKSFEGLGGGSGGNVIHNKLMLDGQTVWQNQRMVNYKRGR